MFIPVPKNIFMVVHVCLLESNLEQNWNIQFIHVPGISGRQGFSLIACIKWMYSMRKCLPREN